MKTETGKVFAVLLILALLITIISANSFTSAEDIEACHADQIFGSNVDHDALERQYENLAREMQAEAQEHEEMFEHNSCANSFGKNERNIK